MQSICFKVPILRGASIVAELSLAVLALVLIPGQVQAQGEELPEVPELAAVLAEKRFEIQQKCLPVHHRDGAAEYINCVRTQVANQKTDSALVLDRFSFDDKYALQQSCSEYYGRNEVYTECLKSEIEKLDSIPEPNLTTLNDDELNALQQNCFEDQKSRGAPAYRSCLNQALARMLDIPRVDLTGLGSVEVNEMKLFCINSSRQLKNANYRLCLAEALANKLKLQRSQNQSAVNAVLPTEAVPSGVLSETNTTAIQAAPDTVNGETVNVASAETVKITEINNESLNKLSIDSTGNVTQGEPATTANNVLANNPGNDSANLSSNQSQPAVVTTTLPDSANTLPGIATVSDPTNESSAPLFSRLVDDPIGTLRTFEIQRYSKQLIFILPLVILLVCVKLLRLLLRKRNDESYAAAVAAAGQAQLRTGLFNDPSLGSSRGSSASKQARSAEAHDHRLDFLQETDDPIEAEPEAPPAAEPVPASEAPTRATVDVEAETPEPDLDETQMPEALALAAEKELARPVYQLSEFSRWISNKPVPEIKRLCTEFMLYWISYGEGNYSQNLKNHLLHSQDLNEHEQIKKWVLEQNPSAFVDLLKQLREIFSTEEIRQTIKLMMAVLIRTEISPVQNTFLRFLADFTNIGSEWLEQEYQASFGLTLPPLPRPDDERWWQRLPEPESEPENADNHDSEGGRALCLQQLGLTARASGEDVAGAYHRIALRCHPERFDQLGEKERNLALRYFDRCTEAHNFLLELEK